MKHVMSFGDVADYHSGGTIWTLRSDCDYIGEFAAQYIVAITIISMIVAATTVIQILRDPPTVW